MSEETFAQGEDLKEDGEPKKRKRSPSSKAKKGDAIAAEECTQRIHQSYGLIGKLFRSSKTRRETDFKEEGAMLSRLSEKYAIVAFILKWLDPIFFVVGIWTKFSEHADETIARRKEEKERKALQTVPHLDESGAGETDHVYHNNPTANYPS